MSTEMKCGGCGAELAPGTMICTTCGWDAVTSIGQTRARFSIRTFLIGGGWRLLVYGLIAATIAGAFLRVRATGLGPDLATTAKWAILGDGGRAAELVTIHRMYETGSAATRYAVWELTAPSFEEGWAESLAPFATIHVRGWIPLLFFGATTETATEAVREIFEVKAVDGWGRRYRVETRELARGEPWHQDPQVAEDLELGLQTSLFKTSQPDFEDVGFLRMVFTSAGRDGEFDTADDLRMISYVPVGHTFHLSQSAEARQRELDRAYQLGRHYFRIEGNRYDLIDARLLAEFRFEMVHG